MCRSMKKPCTLLMKRLADCLTDLNNYLPYFPGYSNYRKMEEEELNDILLHAIPNGIEIQAYLQ